MNSLTSVERMLVRANPFALALGFSAVYLFKAGIWYIPSLPGWSAIAANPFSDPYRGKIAYMYQNWLGPFIAWLLHASDPLPLIILHACFAILMICLGCVGVVLALPPEHRNKAICIFSFVPAFWISLYWIGYDSLTLALMVATLLVIERPVAAYFFGILLGLQHFEQAVIAFSILALVLSDGLFRPTGRRMQAIGAVITTAGAIFGHIVMLVMMKVFEISIDYNRTDWVAEHLPRMIHFNFVLFPTFIYGIFGFGWVVFAFYLSEGSNKLRVGLALIACTLVTSITTDVTRVFLVISFPAVYLLMICDRQWIERISYKQVAALALAWVATPWLFRWDATFHGSVVSYDIQVALHSLTGWPNIPSDIRTDRAIWPFK